MSKSDNSMDDQTGVLQLLALPVGEPGSGAIRYAAAMSAYQQGDMSKELLEVYRQCSKFDHEDPVEVARYLGVKTTAPTRAGLNGGVS